MFYCYNCVAHAGLSGVPAEVRVGILILSAAVVGIAISLLRRI